MTIDVAIIGAGISGLTLARELLRSGRAPVVFERSRGIGGRCATRRILDQPVDHGIAYLHGSSSLFRAELSALGTDPTMQGWPHVVEGHGAPCQPQAFESDSIRVAPLSGVNQLAKQISRDLDVRRETEVRNLVPVAERGGISGWELVMTSGERFSSRAVVLTMPVPFAISLLERVSGLPKPITDLFPVLRMVHTLPCLTVITRYPDPIAPPRWEMSFPEQSQIIQTIVHDSAKRPRGAKLTLVIQARPGFSRQHLKDRVEEWSAHLLHEAALLYGAWIESPDMIQSHAWHHARVDFPSQLAAPVHVRLDGGALFGMTGDAFHPLGGVEGAFLAGQTLATRLQENL